VVDGDSRTLLGLPCQEFKAALKRCQEDLAERRNEQHTQTIEDRAAAFLRRSAIKVSIAVDHTNDPIQQLMPSSARQLGELTVYRATLEREDNKVAFPVWDEEMPSDPRSYLSRARWRLRRRISGSIVKTTDWTPQDQNRM
jgi:hypothetical protein